MNIAPIFGNKYSEIDIKELVSGFSVVMEEVGFIGEGARFLC